MARQHEGCGLQPTAGREQPLQQCRRDREGRVRDDVERPPRQAEVRRVGSDNRDGAPESLPQRLDSIRVMLDRDHPRADPDQHRGDRSVACTDVEHEIAAPDAGIVGQTRSGRAASARPRTRRTITIVMGSVSFPERAQRTSVCRIRP
jgi:hypothetical protein